MPDIVVTSENGVRLKGIERALSIYFLAFFKKCTKAPRKFCRVGVSVSGVQAKEMIKSVFLQFTCGDQGECEKCIERKYKRNV